jgi:hypothetical protein
MCAPKPDPNIGAAAGASAQTAADALAFNKQVYEEGKPAQQQVLDMAQKAFDTTNASQQASDKLAADYADRMKQTFYPLQDSMVKQATDAGGASDQEEYANLARGANATALQGQNEQNARTMQSFGINPNSGAYTGMLKNQGISNAAVQGNAMNQARMAARQLGWAKQSDAVAMGQGLPSSQATSAGLALNATSTGMNASMAPSQTSATSAGVMNQGYSTALSGYGQQGQLGLGIYQGKLQEYAQNMELAGSLAGAAGSVGAAAM